jgi:hypothetical protein
MECANGLRYAPSGYWWVGRDNAALTELGLEPRKRLENAQTPTTMVPAEFAGDRVHAVFGGFCDCKLWFAKKYTPPLQESSTHYL